jgi:hypothetical protein
MSVRTYADFENFKSRIQSELFNHQVITDNAYCQWFERGELEYEDVRHFIVQFSVFSNLFLVAQLKKMVNAVDLEEMRAAKEILANEIGTVFRPKVKESAESIAERNANKEDLGDPSIVSCVGTVDGGRFKFEAAHFEWLLNLGDKIGLSFSDMGKRRHGTPSTLFFCDELERLYGSADYLTGHAASFAVENWAAAGFWKQLIKGLRAFKAAHCRELPLGFFTWHDKVEGQHADHVWDELSELYSKREDFNEDHFIELGNEMLDGVMAFWVGLDQERQCRALKRTEDVTGLLDLDECAENSRM